MRYSLNTQILILKTPSSYIFLYIVFRKILENIGELLKISGYLLLKYIIILAEFSEIHVGQFMIGLAPFSKILP